MVHWASGLALYDDNNHDQFTSTFEIRLFWAACGFLVQPIGPWRGFCRIFEGLCALAKPLFWKLVRNHFPNIPSYILSHDVKLSTVTHKTIVSTVSSTHKQRCHLRKACQDVETALLLLGGLVVHKCVLCKHMQLMVVRTAIHTKSYCLFVCVM